jgi:hypothetical protein
MKLIERSEVLGLADYEAIRERFRMRVVAEKKARRLRLGPSVSVLFENRDTVLLQIQEMLRTERITRPEAVLHEIETYNEQIPGEGELSCTLMIDVEDRDARDAFLQAALGLEKHVWMTSRGQRIQARALERGSEPADRTTAVHYLKFRLPDDLVRALRGTGAARASSELALEIDHSAYRARTVLPPEMLASLAADLEN